jgi:phosphoglucomutase
MDRLERTRAGFQHIEAEPEPKERALHYLGQWLSEPEFAEYQPQLHWLIDSEQFSGLLDRFYQILPFGTGGRRGAVGIGPNRMNRWTLGASVQGHCAYLKQKFPHVSGIRVVLAYDVREFQDQRRQYNPELPNPVLHLSSRALAEYAAGVYAANGITPAILPAGSKLFQATPELSFTIRYLGAQGGLNISASHNPPDDNGGKFYDERGGQPVPPEDQTMADLVDQVREIKHIPWTEALQAGKITLLDEEPHRAYISLCCRQSLIPPPKADEDFKVVFTPLHGVGSMTAMETLTAMGFQVIPVAEQMEPNGQFPNVTRSPNPEVPESMDKAAALARQHQADLVLSTDPDADRLGALIPDRQGGYRLVTGNEIAALLTHFKLDQLARSKRLPASPIVITTEVTTGLITRIAGAFQAQLVNHLLVGFKYIGDVLWHLEKTGAFENIKGTPADFVIATEESHGALVTPEIRDKDAAGAALLLAELALAQKRQGRTTLDYLEQLFRQFGYYRNAGVSVFLRGLEGKQQMIRMLDSLRHEPPGEIAGLAVTTFEDLRDEKGRFGPLKGDTDAASRNVLVFRLGERAKVVLRPSGTEPKAKMYLEVCSDPCPPGARADDWQRTCAEVDSLLEHLKGDSVRQALARIGLDPSAAG